MTSTNPQTNQSTNYGLLRYPADSADSPLNRLRRATAQLRRELPRKAARPLAARREAPLGRKSEFCGHAPLAPDHKESFITRDRGFCGHPSESLELDEKPVRGRKLRYRMQSAAARLLTGVKSKSGADLGKFCARCCRARVDNTSGVKVESDGKKARFGNLIHCDKFWICPECAARMSEQDKRRLNRFMVAAQERGWIPMLATYTMRHKHGDNLEALLTVNAAARRLFKSNSRFEGYGYQDIKKCFGIVGEVINLEVTYGDENAWHPHNHGIPFIDPESASYEGEIGSRAFFSELDRILTRRWQWAVRCSGGDCDRRRGFSLKQGDSAVSDYIAKFGRDPAGQWSIESEIAKSPAKLGRGAKGRTPFQLLADYTDSGDKQAGALFAEYARCFDAKHHLHGLTKLEKLLGIADDCPAADGEASDPERPAFEPVIELPPDNVAWRLLCKAEKRADLLTAALEGYAAVLDLLASVGYQGEPPADLRAVTAGCHTLQPDTALPPVVGPPMHQRRLFGRYSGDYV